MDTHSHANGSTTVASPGEPVMSPGEPVVSPGQHPATYSLVCDTFEKPILDTSSYRLVQLQNRLSVLLISDPSADKAAASLDVYTGAFSDRQYATPGLAHFCEHLLFMGTEKYPVENDYSAYLARHNGASNAYTAAEHTNYYFSVGAAHLHGALDRFANFFICPLFSASCKDREIMAVDSENKKNLQDDLWRLHQLDKSTSNPDHPYHGFSTGNLSTLLHPHIRDTLLQFHQHHYSANLMSLVVYGKEDLDTLVSWASSMFSPVLNQNLPRPNYGGIPIYSRSQLQTLTRAIPINDVHKLEVSFPVPHDYDALYDVKPLAYFSHLLGHEGKGSILSYAKDMGWATELSAGHYRVCQGTSLMCVLLDLTPLGLKEWEQVLMAVFDYLKMISTRAPLKWLWQEIRDAQELSFKFRQKSDPASLVSSMSKNLHHHVGPGPVPPCRLLSSGVGRTFDPHEILAAAKYLAPDNMRITLISKLLAPLRETEEWYGTEFSIEPVPSLLLSCLASDRVNPALHFPRPNQFIPQNFTVLGHTAESPRRLPSLIHNTVKVQTWYKQDDQFMVPKGIVEVILHLPESNTDVFTSTCTALLVQMIEEHLLETTYYASLVGMGVQLATWRDGIDIRLDGYSDKLAALANTVLQGLLQYCPTEKSFGNCKYQLEREFCNFGLQVPFRQVLTHFMTLINEKTYQYCDRLKVLESLTFERFCEYASTIYRGGAFAQALVLGNFDREQAAAISLMVEGHLQPLPQVAESVEAVHDAIAVRNHVLQPREEARYELPLQDPHNINSTVFYHMQIAPDLKDVRLRVLADLLATVMREPCFDQLRTHEQLGYVVFSGINICRSSLGFRILVQSERSTDYLEYRIGEFLAGFMRRLQSMSDSDFEAYKTAYESEKSKKMRHMLEEFSRFNASLTSGFWDFEARYEHVEIARTVSRGDMVAFYQKHILRECGKLVLHLKSQCCPEVEERKLMHCLVINFLARESLEVPSNKVDDILEQCHGDVNQIVTRILQECGSATETLAQEMTRRLGQEAAEPVPRGYPSGKAYATVQDFQNSHALGPKPSPVKPIEEYCSLIKPLQHL